MSTRMTKPHKPSKFRSKKLTKLNMLDECTFTHCQHIISQWLSSFAKDSRLAFFKERFFVRSVFVMVSEVTWVGLRCSCVMSCCVFSSVVCVFSVRM